MKAFILLICQAIGVLLYGQSDCFTFRVWNNKCADSVYVEITKKADPTSKDTIRCKSSDLRRCFDLTADWQRDGCNNQGSQGHIKVYEHLSNLLIEQARVIKLADTTNMEAGRLFVSRTINIARQESLLPPVPVIAEVSHIEIVFKDGYIDELKAVLVNRVDFGEYVFATAFPIGFSSKRSFRQVQDYKLYLLEGSIAGHVTVISLADLIQYNPNVQLDRKDFIPKNGKYAFKPGEHSLKREEKEKLLEARLFTDFQGFRGARPNGLAQVEVEKRLLLNTKLKPAGTDYYPSSVWGRFQYISPMIGYNKIESKDKYLPLTSREEALLPDSTVSYDFNTHAIRLLEYQTFNAGLRLNIFQMTNGNQKLKLSLDTECRLGMTQSTDSLLVLRDGIAEKSGETEVLSNFHLQSGLGLAIQVFGDERLQLTFVNKAMILRPLGSRIYIPLADGRLTNSDWAAYFVHELELAVKLSGDSKIFGRVRLWTDTKYSNYFSQIQVGTSFFIKS